MRLTLVIAALFVVAALTVLGIAAGFTRIAESKDADFVHEVTFSIVSHPLAADLNPAKYSNNPVIAREKHMWDSVDVHHFSVLIPNDSTDNRWHGWYAGNDGTTNRIGHAISDDGINWTKDVNNPVFSLRGKSVNDPYVIRIAGGGPMRFRMFFEVYDLSTRLYSIGMAESADGIEWSYKGEILSANPKLMDETGVSVPLVWFDDYTGRWQMLFSGLTAVEPAWIIWTGRAESADGTNWTKKEVLLDRQGAGYIFPHAFIKDKGTYTALFVLNPDEIHAGISEDFRNWSVSRITSLSRSAPYEYVFGGNAGIGTDGLAVVRYGGRYYVYYSYYAAHPTHRDVGVALTDAQAQ